MSNNPKKRTGLISYGLEIVENIAIEIESNKHNKSYLETKRDKMTHCVKITHKVCLQELSCKKDFSVISY